MAEHPLGGRGDRAGGRGERCGGGHAGAGGEQPAARQGRRGRRQRVGGGLGRGLHARCHASSTPEPTPGDGGTPDRDRRCCQSLVGDVTARSPWRQTRGSTYPSAQARRGRPRGRLAFSTAQVVGTTSAGPSAAQAAAGRCGDPAERPWCDTSLSPDRRAGLRADAADARGEDLAARRRRPPRRGRRGGPAHRHQQGHRATRHPDDVLQRRTGRAAPGTGHRRCRRRCRSPRRSRRAPPVPTPRVIADEVRLKGNDAVYAPGVNIMRTPLNGRTFEYYGEDPFLAARLARRLDPRGPGPRRDGQRQALRRSTTRRASGGSVDGAPIGGAGPGVAARRSTPRSTSGRCARSTCRPSSRR